MRPTQAQVQDSGRKGYLEPHEPPDGTRLRIMRGPFWTDQQEQATYEHAVQSNPILPDEGRGSYMVRIAGLVAGRYLKANVMPRPRLSPREYHQRLRLLESQREQGHGEW